MNRCLIHAFLVASLCIHNCSLDIGNKAMTQRDARDMELDRSYQDNYILGNDYGKYRPSFDDENFAACRYGPDGASPAGLRNKYRMRRKSMKKRRIHENLEDRNYDYADFRNSLRQDVEGYDMQHCDFDDDERKISEDMLAEAPPYGVVADHFTRSKHKTWPLKRLLKIRDFGRKKQQDVVRGVIPYDNRMIPQYDEMVPMKNKSEGNMEKAENEQPPFIAYDQNERKISKNDFDKEHEKLEAGTKHKHKHSHKHNHSHSHNSLKESEDVLDEDHEKGENDGKNDSLNDSAKKSEDLKSKIKDEVANCTASRLNKYLKFFEIGNNDDMKSSLKQKSEPKQTQTPHIKPQSMNLNISISGVVTNKNKSNKISANGTMKFPPSYDYGDDDDRKRRALKIPFINSPKNKDDEVLEKFGKHKTDHDGADKSSGESKAEKANQKSSEKSPEKPPEKSTEKTSPEKSPERPAEKSTEKSSEKSPEKSVEKSSEKSPEKFFAKSFEKTTEKSVEKSYEKSAEKAIDKSVDTDLDESQDSEMGLTPDKLSNEIVKMVSHMVNSNPEMKTLWPSLKYNQPTSKGSEYNLRFEANRNSRKQIEQMLRQTMTTVNDIIQKEVQSRSCVPLSKDLSEFYEAILEMHAKQAKRKEEREEQLAKTDNLDNDVEDEKPKKKKPKSKPKDEEDEEESQNETLYDMMHLRKLQFDREMADARRRREAEKKNYELMLDTANCTSVRRLRQLFSPAFLKLNTIIENLQQEAEFAMPF